MVTCLDSVVELIWKSEVMFLGIILVGLCVGSFLNVVIYRVPRGLSVNEPKRSFCPHCKTTLPAWQNLPVLTWILQAGKCRFCKAPISPRYLLVEALTGALYFAAWYYLPMLSAILAIVLFAILVVVSFIDAEHQIIPTIWTSVGVVIALVGSLGTPNLLWLQDATLLKVESTWGAGLKASALGWVVGFGSLFAMVLLGKLIWGQFRKDFDKPVLWKLQEGFEDLEQLHFVIDGEGYSWDDMFFRSTDELIIKGHGFKVDGKSVPAKEMFIKREQFRIGEKTWSIEKLKSLEGKADHVSIPREAMGMGDPHLLGMIGAFLGWHSVFFIIFVSSVYAMVAAILTRAGFGKALPFGPFLSLAAVTWIFGGWQLWLRYFAMLDGIVAP